MRQAGCLQQAISSPYTTGIEDRASVKNLSARYTLATTSITSSVGAHVIPRSRGHMRTGAVAVVA